MYLASKYILQHVVKAIIFIEPDRTEGRIQIQIQRGIPVLDQNPISEVQVVLSTGKPVNSSDAQKESACDLLDPILAITELSSLICGVLINNCFALYREESYGSFQNSIVNSLPYALNDIVIRKCRRRQRKMNLSGQGKQGEHCRGQHRSLRNFTSNI